MLFVTFVSRIDFKGFSPFQTTSKNWDIRWCVIWNADFNSGNDRNQTLFQLFCALFVPLKSSRNFILLFILATIKYSDCFLQSFFFHSASHLYARLEFLFCFHEMIQNQTDWKWNDNSRAHEWVNGWMNNTHQKKKKNRSNWISFFFGITKIPANHLNRMR